MQQIKILFDKHEIADALNLFGGVFDNGIFKEVPLTEFFCTLSMIFSSIAIFFDFVLIKWLAILGRSIS